MLWPEVPYRNSARRLSAPWALCPGIHGRRNCPCLAQDPRRTDSGADSAPSVIELKIAFAQLMLPGWLAPFPCGQSLIEHLE